jgi:triosephosphate isomerase
VAEALRLPRRPRLVAGNWKMHGTAAEGAALARELLVLLAPGHAAQVALCPPFTSLEAVGRALAGTRVLLGAQNLHAEPEGAYTGEVSGPMLAHLGCRLVVVGHSERRHGMGEGDEVVARKLRAALAAGLSPILCVGELLAEREAGRTEEVLVTQVRGALLDLPEAALPRVAIAYEPVWAIGTGRVATPAQAREAHAVIRATVDRVSGPGRGAALCILYGGSVKADNAPGLFAEDEVDGALVGGASLQAAEFWKIVAAAGAGWVARSGAFRIR